MPSLEPLDFSQPENKMSLYAEAERKKLLPKNDYKETNRYSSVNPDAISDGDVLGKGTGNFLDTTNGGSSTDVAERVAETKFNKYKPENPYTNPV
jgi:hypothetical protein